MPRVRVDLDELDLDTAALIEESARGHQLAVAELREIVSRFLVDDDDVPLPEDQARVAAGKLRIREVRGIFEQLTRALMEVQAAAVPKVTSSP